jgi:hypothetical protein
MATLILDAHLPAQSREDSPPEDEDEDTGDEMPAKMAKSASGRRRRSGRELCVGAGRGQQGWAAVPRRCPGGDAPPSPIQGGRQGASGSAAARASALTRPRLHATRSCRTHRPSASGALGPTPPRRRTQPRRTTAQLCRRTDQVPSTTSLARRSARRLSHGMGRARGASTRTAARATSASAGAPPPLHFALWDQAPDQAPADDWAICVRGGRGQGV